ncbi:hypothetical protein [Oceanobacillus profundus]|uniref:Uncharacterized protein n=1 Tax=Oceanobacillus profundus TaxID=372463 RepID=A0A417YAE9_9BACI|nr:hypothetical protein [Oceanobacillus profundus]MCM3397094.1 hypothetical protein [Oceanobacillus profundus]PAE26992.1 hypothetical protein CHI07_21715 [Paenibacillus sp. 7884-2]RHW29649.1 hypothetical protein D1B32_20750 [Oceanobacillus profundus]
MFYPSTKNTYFHLISKKQFFDKFYQKTAFLTSWEWIFEVILASINRAGFPFIKGQDLYL